MRVVVSTYEKSFVKKDKRKQCKTKVIKVLEKQNKKQYY